MIDLPQPAWTVAADETRVNDSADFGPCHQVIDNLASKAGATLGPATYTTSPQWGRIMRVELSIASSEPRATCWISPEGKVGFFLDFFSRSSFGTGADSQGDPDRRR